MVESNESYITYVKALKELEGLCTKEEFNSLCYWLTISKLTDHPSYQTWTVQKGRFNAFENAKKHLSSVFSFVEDTKANVECSLEELLKYSYGVLQKKKAKQIIEKELGHNIYPMTMIPQNEYSDRSEPQSKKSNLKKSRRGYGYSSQNTHYQTRARQHIDDASASMMCLGLDSKDNMVKQGGSQMINQRRNSFEDHNNLSNVFSNSRVEKDHSFNQKELDNFNNNTPTLQPFPRNQPQKELAKKIQFAGKLFPSNYLKIETQAEKEPNGTLVYFQNIIGDQTRANRLNQMMAAQLQGTYLDENLPEEEEEEEEDEANLARLGIQPSQEESDYASVEKDNPHIEEEHKLDNGIDYTNLEYYSDENGTPNKFRIVSEMDSEAGNDFIEYNITNLKERGVLMDNLPIRAGCFNREYMAIGTNSKCLKICNLGNIISDIEKHQGIAEKYPNYNEVSPEIEAEEIPVIFDQLNHHEGSIYCIDWTECERLIASGSNDKKIKILVWPPLNEIDEGEESENLLELTLAGHQAIVRTLWFHPKNELNLISGGEGDPYLKIWDTETGKNINDLEGHQNGVFCIKPSFDGAFFTSVGKDSTLKVWDLRDQNCAFSIDCAEFGEPTSVAINSETYNAPNKITAVSHTSGTISLWDLNMRKWVNDVKAHEKEARSVSFSFDGKYLATGGFDSCINIMDLTENLKIVKTLKHNNKVISVKWHPHYPLLLSTSADRSARVWATI